MLQLYRYVIFTYLIFIILLATPYIATYLSHTNLIPFDVTLSSMIICVV